MCKSHCLSTSTLLFGLLIIVLAFLIYAPILRVARADMAQRKERGKSNSVVYALLLFPVLGPLLYVLLRKRFVREG